MFDGTTCQVSASVPELANFKKTRNAVFHRHLAASQSTVMRSPSPGSDRQISLRLYLRSLPRNCKTELCRAFFLSALSHPHATTASTRAVVACVSPANEEGRSRISDGDKPTLHRRHCQMHPWLSSASKATPIKSVTQSPSSLVPKPLEPPPPPPRLCYPRRRLVVADIPSCHSLHRACRERTTNLHALQ